MRKILLLLLCCCFLIQRVDPGKPTEAKSGFSYSAHVAAFAVAGLCSWIVADCYIQYKKGLEEKAAQKSQKSKRKRVTAFGGPLGYLFGTIEK